MILVPTVATQRASAEFVFTYFNTDNDKGIHSKPYIFLLGLLMSQYTLTGYDASAHMVRVLPYLSIFKLSLKATNTFKCVPTHLIAKWFEQNLFCYYWGGT